jgi:hypothetical protein
MPDFKMPRAMQWSTYVARRRIADVNAWLAASGITSLGQLVEWCARNNVVAPGPDVISARRAVDADHVEASSEVERPQRRPRRRTQDSPVVERDEDLEPPADE